jgi:PAS domain S-box-containing protein
MNLKVEIMPVEDIPSDAELMKKHPAELSSPAQPDGKNSFKATGGNIGTAYRVRYNRFDRVHRRADDKDYNAGVLLSALNIVRERDLQSTVRDTTDRKLAEKRTLYERGLLRTLIDNLPDMIYVKDSDCRRVIANKADVKNIGFRNEAEILGKTDIELFPGQKGQRGYADDKKVIGTGKSIFEREEDFIDNKGARRWLLTTKVPLKDNGGKITGLVGIGHDITERKQAEAELKEAKIRAEESDRLKKTFLQNLSHEIRTPMNAVIGFSELLETNKFDNEKMRCCTHTIKEKSYELLGIINEILDISLVESGQIPVSKDETDINTLLEETYMFFQGFKRRIEKSHIELSCIKMPDIYNCKIITDSNKVNQILNCLLNNAFKFTDSGSIKFGFHSRHENQLQFFVSDTGMGIPVEKQNIVFDRFRQADEGVTRRKGGLGLGLSITKGLVEVLEGKIWLVSGPENGTTFYFTLPIRLPEAKRYERFESHTGYKKISAGFQNQSSYSLCYIKR